jgi:threonine synthase
MSRMSIPWTPGLGLRCPACEWSGPPDLHPAGCPACGHPLETTYPADARWRIALPAASLTDLGRTATPLIQAPHDPVTFLKLESRNPTGSHKDRFHMVGAAIARAADAPGMFTTSTGNHGVSCAAHAAREGLRCVVLSTSALPHPLAVQLIAHGAIIGRLDPAGRRHAVDELAARGWFAATSSDPLLTGASTPFGTDGYRLVVDEIVDSLGRLPDVVSVPCAGGDTLVGLRRGLDDVAARAGAAPVTLLACEPTGADALARSVAAGRPVDVAEPHSIARSTADTSVGRLAIAAASRDGAPVVVSDGAIADETRALARTGLYVETSSALALAGIRQARRDGIIAADALAIAVLTAHGRGWSENEPGLFDLSFADDVDGLLRAIST